MRYGVLSDVHGNLPALEVALRTLRREGVDAFLHLGDLVGYGPFPNECVEVIKGLEGHAVAGNHDLIVLGRLPAEGLIAVAAVTLEWTRQVLGDDARDYLESLPLRASAPGGVVLAHGSLDDPAQYVRLVEQARVQLERLRVLAPDACALLLGHTHQAWVVDGPGHARIPTPGHVIRFGVQPSLLNPGSVGQSRTRLLAATFMLLDTDRRTATWFAEPYEVERTTRELKRLGLPPNAVHLPPPRFHWLRRTVRRVLPH